MSKNKVQVKICGNELNILSDDNAEYTQKIAQLVDRKMKEILDASPRASIASAAILASLDFCDMLKKSEENADGLRAQINEYLEDSSKSRAEADAAKKEIEKLEKELQTLRQRLQDKEASVKDKKKNNDEPLSTAVKKSKKSRTVLVAEEGEEAAEENLSFFSDNGVKTKNV